MEDQYLDICDYAYKRNPETGDVFILRIGEDGEVFEDNPSDYESDRFDHHWNYDAKVISKEIAYALAKNPGLSY